MATGGLCRAPSRSPASTARQETPTGRPSSSVDRLVPSSLFLLSPFFLFPFRVHTACRFVHSGAVCAPRTQRAERSSAIGAFAKQADRHQPKKTKQKTKHKTKAGSSAPESKEKDARGACWCAKPPAYRLPVAWRLRHSAPLCGGVLTPPEKKSCEESQVKPATLSEQAQETTPTVDGVKRTEEKGKSGVQLRQKAQVLPLPSGDSTMCA